MWFARFGSDRALRTCPVEGPFALSLRQGNADRLHCLNEAAEAQGLQRGMALSEARAFCPGLQVRPADPAADARQLAALRRWAVGFCPWVGTEGPDGLVLDITGSAHLQGGEVALLETLQQRLARAGFGMRAGLADTRGAAWALAHFAPGIAAPGASRQALSGLPVAALRITADVETGLQRLGLRRIGDLMAAARAPLARRFGQGLLEALDRALGDQPEAISPAAEPPHYATRLTLPEPIGLVEDVMAGLVRLLDRLCAKLKVQGTGARALCLSLRRVDGGQLQVPVRLAAPMRDPSRIAPLFRRGVEAADAGFGIDQLRLEATLVQPMPAEQIGTRAHETRRVEDLVTRIGTRIGLDNVLRFRPVDSHIPTRNFELVPAASSEAATGWPRPPRPRPLCLFPPEPIPTDGANPPARFRWRRMRFATGRATGPERIAPEWWIEDAAWRSGIRDYWRIETVQGRRLWLFHTPQNPGWYVHGEFM